MHTMVYLWLLLFTYIKFRQLQENNLTLAYSVVRLLQLVQIQQVSMYNAYNMDEVKAKSWQRNHSKSTPGSPNSQLLRRNSELASLGQPFDWSPLLQEAGRAAVGVSQNQPPRSSSFHSPRTCRVNPISLQFSFLYESTCFVFPLKTKKRNRA